MELSDNNATFLDVRTASEYREEHIPNAINIPLNEVHSRIREIKTMKSPLIIYCRSGNRSKMAVIMLKQIGMQNVLNGGGLEDVKRALS